MSDLFATQQTNVLDAKESNAKTAQSMNTHVALEVNGLSCHYGQTQVLHTLDLTVKKGEIVCLLGASGCGKTTLLKAIAGLLPLTKGKITLNQKLLDDASQQTAPEHRNMGLIFQDYALFPHLTVAQNIGFGLTTLSSQEKQQQVNKMLTLVHLESLGERYPHELSGGQQQRVAIARSLAYQPDLLLLDEPFSNIDTQVRQSLIADIRTIFKKQGVTAIFVTHSREEAFAFSDSMAVMNHGIIEQFGSSTQLYYQPASPFVANFLGGGSYLSGEVMNEHEVRTCLGDLQVNVSQFKASDRVRVLLRPQNIHLSAAELGSSEHVVQQVQFMGDHCRYTFECAGQEFTAVSDVALHAGQAVDFKIRMQDLIVFSEQCWD